MPSFRRGAEAIEEAATRRGGRAFNRYIRWGKTKEEKTKLIQFLTPLDETYTVLVHDFVAVNVRDNGKFQYENFISRRDRGLDGLNGWDPITDVWGVLPKERTIGLAIELEQIKEGKRTVGVRPKVAHSYENRDGEEVEVPAIGYIVQAPSNFWSLLSSWEAAQEEFGEEVSITQRVFSITKQGEKSTVTYPPTELTKLPVYDLANLEVDFPGFELPDLDKFIEELSDLDNQKHHLQPLVDKVEGAEDPWDAWPIGNREFRPEDWKKNRAKTIELTQEQADEVDEAAEEEKPKSRSSRLQQLRDEAAAGKL